MPLQLPRAAGAGAAAAAAAAVLVKPCLRQRLAFADTGIGVQQQRSGCHRKRALTRTCRIPGESQLRRAFHLWISDNNLNLSTLYSGIGAVETQTITGSPNVGIVIPASAAGVPANPTGQVYNGNGGFLIPTANGQESALFIFDGEGGTISAWAGDSGAAAVTAYDDGVANAANHAVYKGLALGTVGGATYLYATDLHITTKSTYSIPIFAKPAAMQGKFSDPNLPAGFVPFGIAALNGNLYVTFAKQDAAKHDETTGAGLRLRRYFRFQRQLGQSICIGRLAQRAVGHRDCAGRIRLSPRRCADRQFWRWNDKHLLSQRVLACEL